MTLRIFLSAGEASGDALGAALARALRARVPEVELYGMGGPAMAAAGVRRLRTADELNVVGLVEVLRHLPRLLGLLGDLARRGVAERPAVAVLIDAPDFHVRLAPYFQRAGIPTVQYVGPSVWAWRAGRARRFRRVMARILVLFPFETAVWEAAATPVRWVGHPIVDQIPSGLRSTFEPGLLAVLPGSRRSEIERLLAPMLDAAARLAAEGRVLRIVIPVAPTLRADVLAARPEVRACPVPIEWVEATDSVARYHTIARAEAAIVASGTATLETALIGVPHVLVYRVNRLSWFLGRPFVRIRWLGLANLLLGEQVVPELLQEAAQGELIAQAVAKLMTAPGEQQAALARLREVLGDGGAAERAADAVLELAATP